MLLKVRALQLRRANVAKAPAPQPEELKAKEPEGRRAAVAAEQPEAEAVAEEGDIRLPPGPKS